MAEKNNSDCGVSGNSISIRNYFKDLRKLDTIPGDEQAELAIKAKGGDQRAMNKLVESNLRFVLSIAKDYSWSGIPLEELSSEGNIGLIKAVSKFDETKGVKFISYAVWWIKQSILQSLNENSRTIRLPVNVVQDMHKEKKENEKTNKDLSEKFATLPRMIDLDMHINEDGDTLIDIIKNDNVESPDEIFSTKDLLKEKMMNIMGVLDNRERAIVEDYYGITGTPRTLEDIGSDFSLTKERVRQIKEKALRKLRNECSDLFEYL